MTAITDILARAAGDYSEDSELIAAVFGPVMSANCEHGFGPFICGVLSKKDLTACTRDI